MSELIFQEDGHKYILDGQEIPSVNQVLHDMGFSGSRWYTEESAGRGREIHRITACLDNGQPIETDAELLPFLEDYRAFRQQYPGFQWFRIEEPVANEIMRYGATPDRIGVDPEGHNCILDIKSGKPAAWHRVQLAAYDFSKTAKRYGLYLSDEPGKFKLVPFTDPEDYVVWEYAVWLWWWERRYL